MYRPTFAERASCCRRLPLLHRDTRSSRLTSRSPPRSQPRICRMSSCQKEDVSGTASAGSPALSRIPYVLCLLENSVGPPVFATELSPRAPEERCVETRPRERSTPTRASRSAVSGLSADLNDSPSCSKPTCLCTSRCREACSQWRATTIYSHESSLELTPH